MTNNMAVKLEGPEVQSLTPEAEVPEDLREQAAQWLASYDHSMRQWVDAAARQLADARPEIGTTTWQGYKYWDVVLVGPQQFFGDPPWRPSRIIAAGEWTRVLGIVFVNPARDPGGGIAGRVALGARQYRVKMETINLSSVTNGPDAVGTATFPTRPPIFTYWEWWFRAPDPGLNPQLYETYFTADVTIGDQPFAAFSTWHYNPDSDPGFLIPRPSLPGGPAGGSFPTQPPGWHYERPARYLVYRE